MNQCPAHPREVFRHAVMDNVASVILAHNHPSGSTAESDEDIALTRILVAAGKIMQVPVLDHLIMTRCGMASMCRHNPNLFEA